MFSLIRQQLVSFFYDADYAGQIDAEAATIGTAVLMPSWSKIGKDRAGLAFTVVRFGPRQKRSGNYIHGEWDGDGQDDLLARTKSGDMSEVSDRVRGSRIGGVDVLLEI